MKNQIQVRLILRIMSLLVLTAFLTICGCSSNSAQSSSKNEYCRLSNRFAETADKYVLRGNGLLLLYDKQSGEQTPYCFRSNCSHEPFSPTNESPDCPAAVLYRDSGGHAGLYGGYLYYIKDESKSISDGNGTLMKADPDGENTRGIAAVSISGMGFGSISIFANGHFYTTGQSFEVSENIELRPVIRNTLWEIDLNTGNCTLLNECVSEETMVFQILDVDEHFIYYAQNSQSEVLFRKRNLLTGKEEIFMNAPSALSASMRNDLILYISKDEELYSVHYFDVNTTEKGQLLENLPALPGLCLLQDRGILLTQDGCYTIDYNDKILMPTGMLPSVPIGEANHGLLFSETSYDGNIEYKYMDWNP